MYITSVESVTTYSGTGTIIEATVVAETTTTTDTPPTKDCLDYKKGTTLKCIAVSATSNDKCISVSSDVPSIDVEPNYEPPPTQTTEVSTRPDISVSTVDGEEPVYVPYDIDTPETEHFSPSERGKVLFKEKQTLLISIGNYNPSFSYVNLSSTNAGGEVYDNADGTLIWYVDNLTDGFPYEFQVQVIEPDKSISEPSVIYGLSKERATTPIGTKNFNFISLSQQIYDYRITINNHKSYFTYEVVPYIDDDEENLIGYGISNDIISDFTIPHNFGYQYTCSVKIRVEDSLYKYESLYTRLIVAIDLGDEQRGIIDVGFHDLEGITPANSGSSTYRDENNVLYYLDPKNVLNVQSSYYMSDDITLWLSDDNGISVKPMYNADSIWLRHWVFYEFSYEAWAEPCGIFNGIGTPRHTVRLGSNMARCTFPISKPSISFTQDEINAGICGTLTEEQLQENYYPQCQGFSMYNVYKNFMSQGELVSKLGNFYPRMNLVKLNQLPTVVRPNGDFIMGSSATFIRLIKPTYAPYVMTGEFYYMRTNFNSYAMLEMYILTDHAEYIDIARLDGLTIGSPVPNRGGLNDGIDNFQICCFKEGYIGLTGEPIRFS